jgi:LuxR family transcriptional regulator, quorum-sensing system regulator BjaR1
MDRYSADVRHSTFEFIQDVERLSTTGEIMDAMGAVLNRYGFKYFCFNFLPNSTQKFEDVLLANRLPVAWLKLYVEEQFVHADPSIRHCRKMVRPYRWKEAPYDPEREPRAVEVVQRAMDFGLSDGFVIPIASPASRVGHVWVGGQTLDLPDRDMPAVHLMALYAFDRVLQLHRPHPEQEPNLTPREREVLTLVALGKSTWEIGQILKISSRTVNEHITHSRRKLGAVNRAQAVMIGLRDRIIQP